MLKKELYIGVDYIPYLINGDASIFDYYNDDSAQGLIDDLTHELYHELGDGHFEVVYDCGGAIMLRDFKHCDATGDLTDCALVNYVYHGA